MDQKLIQVAPSKARQIAYILDGGAVTATGWAYIDPQPYPIIMGAMIAMPWVAIAMIVISKDTFAIDDDPKNGRASLAALFICPGLVLALRVMTDMHVLEWKPVLVATLVGLILFALILAVTDHWKRRSSFIAAVLLSTAYCYGATVMLNGLLDRSEAKVYPVKVLAKHVSRSRKSTTYHFEIAPWGPMFQNDDVNVTGFLYQQVRVGQNICVILREGALKVPWFGLEVCPTDF